MTTNATAPNVCNHAGAKSLEACKTSATIVTYPAATASIFDLLDRIEDNLNRALLLLGARV